MTSLIRVGLVVLGCGLAMLLAACSGPASAPPPVSVEDVRSVEILYSYSGWSRADEVHRLQRGPGQRSFTRTSKVEAGDSVETTHATVPAQRVAELLWALSAPPWPRERAVQVVARRVHPVAVLEHAGGNTEGDAPGCTADEIRNRMYRQLQGAALRARVDAHYQTGMWTDDYPSMRVVISFRRGPDRVISSTSQKLLMLPWALGDFPASEEAQVPLSWSAPVSDALRRLLPLDSQAAQRLGRDPSDALTLSVERAALVECEAEMGGAR
jgi:hypothetical protein